MHHTHDSVAALQEIINDNRDTIRTLTRQLKRPKKTAGEPPNPHHLKTLIADLTKLTDLDELLIREYYEAVTDRHPTQIAVTLARIQYAAAKAIETRNEHMQGDT